MWIATLLTKLGAKVEQSMKPYGDGQETLCTKENPIFPEHAKHIEPYCHVITQKVTFIYPIYTQFVKSKDNLAYGKIFTNKQTGYAQYAVWLMVPTWTLSDLWGQDGWKVGLWIRVI